jgi:hypothetical protein
MSLFRLSTLAVAIGSALWIGIGAASAQTAEELKQAIALKKAEIAKLEQQLRDIDRGHSDVNRLPPPRSAGPSSAAQMLPPINDDEIDRALERTLVREGALVLPAYSYELTPHFSLAHWDSVQNPQLRNSYGAGLTFRMGLPARSQVSVTVPYVVSDWTNRGTSSGFADVGFVFSKELLLDTDRFPMLLGSIGWTSPTDRACCARPIPYVSGFQVGLTAVQRFDPLVAFASVFYFSSISRNITGTTTNPSDVIATRLGASLAVTPALSLTGGLNIAFLTDPTPASLPVPNSDRILSSVDFGFTTVLWSRTLLNFTTQVGLTGNLPDFRLITSVPTRF